MDKYKIISTNNCIIVVNVETGKVEYNFNSKEELYLKMAELMK